MTKNKHNFLESEISEILEGVPNSSSEWAQSRLKEAILLLAESIDDLHIKIVLKEYLSPNNCEIDAADNLK